MGPRRILFLHDRTFGGEIDESIKQGLEANASEVTCQVKGTAWEPEFDLVIAYGPFDSENGHLLTVARQVSALPRDRRPRFVWWLTENPPPSWIPRPAAIVAAKMRLWGDERLPPASALPTRWRDVLLRGHRLRVLGQVREVWRRGWLDRLVVTNQARARFFQAHGLKPLVVPLGYHRAYGEDLGLVRDLDVTFIGQTDSRRRRRILPGLFREIESRGISVEIANRLYGDARTQLLNRSKILLNVLRAPQDFVGQRLILGAANRALVVSEPMLDPYPFEAGRHLRVAPVSALADEVERALSSEADRRRMVDETYRFVTEDLACERMLERVIAGLPDPASRSGSSNTSPRD